MSVRRLLLPILLLFATLEAYAGGDGTKESVENVDKYRFGVDFQISLAKGLKLNIEPELRFDDGFDVFMLSGGVTYRTFGSIYWGATYRLMCDRETLGTVQYGMTSRTEYEWEYFHRYAFDVTYKEKFSRFTPSFRLRYNNFTDDDISNKEFLRYRAKLDYDIRKCKLTPYVSAEAFQELDEGMLYKMRYTAGADYRVNKKSSFSFDYKLDFFTLKYKNAHIFSFGYKCRL